MIPAPRPSLRAGGLFLAMTLGLIVPDARGQFAGMRGGFGGNPGLGNAGGGLGQPGNGFGQGMGMAGPGAMGMGGMGGIRGGSLPPAAGMMVIGRVIMDNTGGPKRWDYGSMTRGAVGRGAMGAGGFGRPRRAMRSVPPAASAPSSRRNPTP